jgi:PKD repeat protein
VSGSSFKFSAGFSDPGGKDRPWSWVLSWGEATPTTGTALDQTFPIEPEHRYMRVGTYTATLTVTDKDSGIGSATTIVTVVPQTVSLSTLPFIAGRTPLVIYNPRKPPLSEPVVTAILGSTDFAPVDPVTRKAAVDLGSVRLGSVPVASLNGIYVAAPVDVNHDGRLDLVLTFQTDKLVQAGNLNPNISTPQTLTLTGNHVDGRQFSATLQIVVIARGG